MRPARAGQAQCLCLFVLALTLSVCAVAAQSRSASTDPDRVYPLCVEDGHVYQINASEVTFGALSGARSGDTDGGAMCAETDAGLLVAQAPAAPSLLYLTQGWNYIFGAYVADGSTRAGRLNFTLHALCDGVVVCKATIFYDVAGASRDDDVVGSSGSGGDAAQPRCTVGPSTRTYAFDVVYTDEFPHDIEDSTCRYLTQVEQPTMGAVAVLLPGHPLRYVFVARGNDTDRDAHATVPYTISCNDTVVCHGSLDIALRATAPHCPSNDEVFEVMPETTRQGVLHTGAKCPNSHDELTTRVVHERTTAPNDTAAGQLVLAVTGTAFHYRAPATEMNDLYTVRVYCNDEPLCESRVGFMVTRNTLAPAPVESSSTSPSASRGGGSDAESRDESASSLPPSVARCAEGRNYTVPVGRLLRGTLHIPLEPGCELVTYHAAPRPGEFAGTLEVNLVGDFVYTAPAQEALDVAYVNVSCLNRLVCRAEVFFAAYHSLLPDASASATAECPNVYFYNTAPMETLRGSLDAVPGGRMCDRGRFFALVAPVSRGTLTLTAAGDFVYTAGADEGQDGFTFDMYCLGEPACRGHAYVVVSRHLTPPPSSSASSSQESASSHAAPVPNPQIRCQGTCRAQAWRTYPEQPRWDVDTASEFGRKDGRPLDGLQVAWHNSTLVFEVYTLIGNLGVRFPTFEPLRSTPTGFLEPADFVGTVSPDSVGFELDCLRHQGRDGRGDDVWRWTSERDGDLGPLYRRGASWYQKFGGKHVQCDTFADACRYAPLLTPAGDSNASHGRWTIDVDDCDATWRGVFSFRALTRLRGADGRALWTFTDVHTLRGTLLSQAVRPSSWREPGRFDTQLRPHDIAVDLRQFVMVRKPGSVDPRFSVDAEYFTFRADAGNVTGAGDYGFGINLLVYPFVTPAMTSSYAADRHVTGFKWLRQRWVAPSSGQCRGCTGDRMQCNSPSEPATSAYTGPFADGDCPGNTARVRLVKGPAMSLEQCPAHAMHVYHQPGFSAPRNCRHTYQNLTLRGLIPGSASLTTQELRRFFYEGTVRLQLLLGDGSKELVDLTLSLYVARLAQDEEHGAGWALRLCRSGSYWPVLDPLGLSVPDRPFALSASAPAALCVDELSSSFGPSDWALFTLVMPGVAAGRVVVRNVYVADGAERVYLHYRDPVTGLATTPPRTLGRWWRHTDPYFAFRDLAGRAANRSLSTGNQIELQDAVYAFAFVPGAINRDCNLEVVLEASVTGANRTTVSTFRRMLNVDPQLTQLSRQGPSAAPARPSRQDARGDLYALGATAGITVAIIITAIFFMLADNRRPLPKWVPRGKLIKQTVLSVLPPGLRGKRKEKRVMHRDMYAAMNSGRY